MLVTIFVLMFSRYLDTTELRLTFQLEEGCQIPLIIIITIAVFAFVIRRIISPGKKLDAYMQEWDEPEISVARKIYVATVTFGFTHMLYSIEKQQIISSKFVTTWLVLIAILDVVNIIVIYNYYVLDLLDSIKSAFCMQMSDVMKSLWIIILFMAIFKFTTYGVLILVFTIGSFVGWLLKKII